MNNSHIDVLLQLPVPRSESVPTVARPRYDSSEFDNHFRQASDTGGAPPSSLPRPTEPTANESQRRSTRPEDRATTKAEEHSSQADVATDPASAAADASAEQDAQAAEQQADSEESQDDENAAIVAAITAAEVRAKSAVSVAQQNDAAHPDGKHPDVDRASAATEQQDPKNAKQAGTPSAAEAQPVRVETRGAESSVPGDIPQVAVEQVDAAEQDSAAKAAHDASKALATLNDAAAEPVGETESERSTDTKAARHGVQHEPEAAGAAAKELSLTESVGTAPAVNKKLAPAQARSESVGEGAPKKGDKKTNGRTLTTIAEASTTPAERPVATARPADASVTAPAAANVQQQLSTSGVTAAATTDSTAKPKDAAITAKQGLLSPFARLERGAHATRSGQSDGAPHVDPARFVSRVARAIHTAQERGAPLQLRLSPPELGAMRLELSMNQGTLTASIETENSTTRQLLLDNLPALRERLAEQNVKIERFDVDVRRDSTGSQQNPAPQDGGNTEHHQRGSGRHASPRTSTAPPSLDEAQPIRRSITNTSINVVA